MLSCYGFAVLAHNMIGGGHVQADRQTAQAVQVLVSSVSVTGALGSDAGSALTDDAKKTLAGDTNAALPGNHADAASAGNTADAASDDDLSVDEAGSEHAELVDARNGAPALLRFTEQPPKLGLTTTVAPFLARPKRPPRAASFVA